MFSGVLSTAISSLLQQYQKDYSGAMFMFYIGVVVVALALCEEPGRPVI
ncbi:hypothetical protein HNQ85_002739 [Anoxybacillus calidus]|jgi:hypothetical protein|uniref:Uncharacterized protein n=1 Tax=[Anoxybacillus] calidus TaxID=575178 RepID=A0A7V9Z1Z1_9BACL|nr:hypothetical protein [Anoxybacillus calidus]